MPVVNDYTALLSGYQWYVGPPGGRALVLTYSFSTAPERAMAGRSDLALLGFQPMDEAARALTRQALALWSAVSGVTFLEVSQSEGDLTFGMYNFAALRIAGAAGTGSYPSIVGAIDGRGDIRLYPTPLHDGGDVHIETAYREAATDADLLHVLLQQIGQTLGLKPPHVGDVFLLVDNGDLSVMSYAGPRNAFLGPYDVQAIQALYGSPTGALRPETWTWDAASETYTASIAGDNQYLRGTESRDVLTALGTNARIVSMGGDDVATIGSGAAEVNLGDGYDVLNVETDYRPDQGMGFFTVGTSFYQWIGGNLQSYYGVEKLNFTNGSYDTASRIFTFNLPPPEAPVFRHWWVDVDNQLVIAGTGMPGSVVRFQNIPNTATVAEDGTWTLAPLNTDPRWSILTAVATWRGQDSAAVPFGMREIGLPTEHTVGDHVRGYLRGGGNFYSGPGDDLMYAYAMFADTLILPDLQAETRIGVAGELVVLRGSAGMDTTVGIDQVQFADALVDIATVAERAEPMMTMMVSGHPRYILADLYGGALPGLRYRLTGDGSNEIVLGSTDADLIDLGGGNDRLSGLAGNDVLDGGAGDDVIDGGEGSDTARFAGLREQYRIGLMDGEIRVRGPDGNDTLRGIELLQFGDTAAITVASLQGSPGTEELMSLLVDGTLQLQLPDEYAGPLDLRYVFTGTDGSDMATGTEQNDFINLKDGDDAAAAHGGDDIVDGGAGNNFLSGGAGRDTFFIDGRFLVPVWSCVTDWEPGEQVAIWGWQQGVSTYSWGESGGLPGYLGATFYGDLDGNGLVETAVTVAGRAVAELPGGVAQSASGIGVLTFG